MIRTKTKILGEPNNPTAVSMDKNIVSGWAIGAGNKKVKTTSKPVTSKLFIIKNGILSELTLSSNKAIATDANGNIILINRSDVK